MSRAPLSVRAWASRALEVAARVRSGTKVAERSLPIRRRAEDIRRSWDDPAGRAAVLDEIEVVDASLELEEGPGDRGATATIRIVLETAMPRMAAQTLAGRAVRRLKALAETGEVPTTERNPSARDTAEDAQ